MFENEAGTKPKTKFEVVFSEGLQSVAMGMAMFVVHFQTSCKLATRKDGRSANTGNISPHASRAPDNVWHFPPPPPGPHGRTDHYGAPHCESSERQNSGQVDLECVSCAQQVHWLSDTCFYPFGPRVTATSRQQVRASFLSVLEPHGRKYGNKGRL